MATRWLLLRFALPWLLANLGCVGELLAEPGWVLDRVALVEGGAVEGLIAAEDDEEVELMEVRRPAGRPMFLVVRPIPRKQIASIVPLDESERAKLRGQLDHFIGRAQIEARQRDALVLEPIERDGIKGWHYRGRSFELESTTDEATARRAIVRIEQVFAGFRQLLPPRIATGRQLKILLFGATAEYTAYSRGLGLELSNPAFFAADFNVVAAGSETNRFNAELSRVVAEHLQQRAAIELERSKLPERMAELSAKLVAQGLPIADRRAVLAAEERNNEEQFRGRLQAISQADRRNAARFDEVTGTMFARLYHEAFHAYLDNRVYPHTQFDVPRWLNEGLAMCFEASQLDGEVLRVDAPNARALSALRADLRSARPLALEELLSADAETFLAAHGTDATSVARLYAYSWGLAYHLAFERSLLDAPEFARYVSLESSSVTSRTRFEQLVGQSLTEFEPAWRTAILGRRK